MCVQVCGDVCVQVCVVYVCVYLMLSISFMNHFSDKQGNSSLLMLMYIC